MSSAAPPITQKMDATSVTVMGLKYANARLDTTLDHTALVVTLCFTHVCVQ